MYAIEDYTNIFLVQIEKAEEEVEEDQEEVEEEVSSGNEPCLLGFVNFTPDNPYKNSGEPIISKQDVLLDTLFINPCADDDTSCEHSLWKYQGDCRKELRFKAFAKFKDGRQLPSGYVTYQASDIKNNVGTITLNPQVVLDDADRKIVSGTAAEANIIYGEVNDHAVYIQAYDMSSETATN